MQFLSLFDNLSGLLCKTQKNWPKIGPQVDQNSGGFPHFRKGRKTLVWKIYGKAQLWEGIDLVVGGNGCGKAWLWENKKSGLKKSCLGCFNANNKSFMN